MVRMRDDLLEIVEAQSEENHDGRTVVWVTCKHI
jgi:hypothetical protein